MKTKKFKTKTGTIIVNELFVSLEEPLNSIKLNMFSVSRLELKKDKKGKFADVKVFGNSIKPLITLNGMEIQEALELYDHLFLMENS